MKKINLVAIIASLMFALLFGGFCFAEYVPCKVSLNLFERIIVLGLLPEEGNFITLKIVNELKMELSVTEEEYKKAGLYAMESGGIQAKDWFAVPEKEITFGEVSEGIIVNALKKLDKEMKLRNEHMTVYAKFIKE